MLSSTATSRSTVVTSLLNVGAPGETSFPLRLNLEGIFGSSEESSFAAGALFESAAGGGVGAAESAAGASFDVSGGGVS